MKVKNLSVEITAPNLLLNAKKTTNFAFFQFLLGIKQNLMPYAAFTLTFEAYTEVLA